MAAHDVSQPVRAVQILTVACELMPLLERGGDCPRMQAPRRAIMVGYFAFDKDIFMTVSTLMAMAAGGAVRLYLISAYNRLVALRNQFKNAFAQIEVQLKRRYDLIPNLVEIAEDYLSHERAML